MPVPSARLGLSIKSDLGDSLQQRREPGWTLHPYRAAGFSQRGCEGGNETTGLMVPATEMKKGSCITGERQERVKMLEANGEAAMAMC